jgi:hypothetical protein
MWGVFHQAAELVVSDQHIEVRDQLLIALSLLHARPAVLVSRCAFARTAVRGKD